MKVLLPLVKNVFTPLVNTVFIPLGLTAATSDAEIYEKLIGSVSSGSATTMLIISNGEMEDIMKKFILLNISDS